jgi:hypothetical protein
LAFYALVLRRIAEQCLAAHALPRCRDSISSVDRAAIFSFVHSIIKSTHPFDFSSKFRSFSTFCVNFTSLALGETADTNIKQNGWVEDGGRP